jgi:hypothetical protein
MLFSFKETASLTVDANREYAGFEARSLQTEQ